MSNEGTLLCYSSERAQPIVLKFGMWLDTHQSNSLEESEVGSHQAHMNIPHFSI